MTDEEIRKQQIAKLKSEIAGMDEIFYEDFDRFEKKYDLPRRTVMAVCSRSGKYDHDAHLKAREIDSYEPIKSLKNDSPSSQTNRDNQYGVLQPVANAGAGCFTWIVCLGLIFLVIAALLSLFK